MDNKMIKPEKQSPAAGLIDFFKNMPAENNLPPDLFRDLIADLEENPGSVIAALEKWLENLEARKKKS
jgi:hypothetical protein